MKRTKKLLAISIVALLIFGGTLVVGTLISGFGTVRTKANVTQAVMIDGQPYDQWVLHELDIVAGCDECFVHVISNAGCEDAWLSWSTSGIPDLEGITVTYHGWECITIDGCPPTCGCGDELPGPFLLRAGSRMKFCVCYDFDVMLSPGLYKIKSILLPSDPPE